MSHPSNNALAARLDELETLLAAMRQLLADEQYVLVHRRVPETSIDGEDADGDTKPPGAAEALAELAARKQSLCELLSEERFAGLADDIAAAEPGERTQYEARHTTLMEMAHAVRDSNLVNGKILARSQHVTREILNILSGRSFEGLYGQSGQPTSDPDRSGTAIAKA